MKYVPAQLLSTHADPLQALLSLGCTEARAQELLQEAAMSKNPMMLIENDEDEHFALSTGPDGKAMLWQACIPLACKTEKEALDFVDHMHERQQKPATWGVFQWQEVSLH